MWAGYAQQNPRDRIEQVKRAAPTIGATVVRSPQALHTRRAPVSPTQEQEQRSSSSPSPISGAEDFEIDPIGAPPPKLRTVLRAPGRRTRKPTLPSSQKRLRRRKKLFGAAPALVEGQVREPPAPAHPRLR